MLACLCIVAIGEAVVEAVLHRVHGQILQNGCAQHQHSHQAARTYDTIPHTDGTEEAENSTFLIIDLQIDCRAVVLLAHALAQLRLFRVACLQAAQST